MKGKIQSLLAIFIVLVMLSSSVPVDAYESIDFSFFDSENETQNEATTYEISITNTLSTDLKFKLDNGSLDDFTAGSKLDKTVSEGKHVFRIYKSDGSTLLDERTADISDAKDYSLTLITMRKNFSLDKTEIDAEFELTNPWFSFAKDYEVKNIEGEVVTVDSIYEETVKGIIGYYAESLVVDLIPKNLNEYAENVCTNAFTGASGTLTLTINQTQSKEITVFDDVELFVGIKVAHFKDFKEIDPVTKTGNGDGTKTYEYKLGKGQEYGLKANGDSDKYLTFSARLTKSGSWNSLDLTIDGLMINDKDGRTAKTTLSRFDVSSTTDFSDIYGNIGSKGWSCLKVGETKTLDVFRVWQGMTDGIENYFIEPDMHYEVIGGNDGVVKLNGREITALKNGTAIIKVYYDAMKFKEVGKQDDLKETTFFYATAPENTYVAVITVNDSGAMPNIDSGTVINEGLNERSEKMSMDYIDCDIDVFYYREYEDGYEYIFTPDTGSEVKLYTPIFNNGELVGFETSTITGVDGSFTVLLKEGRNIVQVTKNGESVFQVIRALTYQMEITNLTSSDRGINEALPYDEIKLTFNGITSLQKLAGLYNSRSGEIYLTDDQGHDFSVTAAQYKLGVGKATMKIEVPEGTEQNWKLRGYVLDHGQGCPAGEHQLISSESGRQKNFSATTQDTYLSAIAPIVINIKEATYDTKMEISYFDENPTKLTGNKNTYDFGSINGKGITDFAFFLNNSSYMLVGSTFTKDGVTTDKIGLNAEPFIHDSREFPAGEVVVGKNLEPGVYVFIVKYGTAPTLANTFTATVVISEGTYCMHQYILNDDTIKIPDCSEFAIESAKTQHKEFDYWKSSDGTKYYPGDIVRNVTSDFKVEAVWKNATTYEYSFVVMGETVLTGLVYEGETLPPAPNISEKTIDNITYKLNSWENYKDGMTISENTVFNALFDVTINKDIEDVKDEKGNVVIDSENAVSVSMSASLITGIKTQLDSGKTASIENANGAILFDKNSFSGVTANTVISIKENTDPKIAEIAGNSPVYDINVGDVHKFGSKLVVSLKYELKEGENANDLKIWHFDDRGNYTKLDCIYDEESGCVIFETDSLSPFAIVKETPENNDDNGGMPLLLIAGIAIAVIALGAGAYFFFKRRAA